MSLRPWNTTLTLRSADALAAMIRARRWSAFRSTATVLGLTDADRVAFVTQILADEIPQRRQHDGARAPLADPPSAPERGAPTSTTGET